MKDFNEAKEQRSYDVIPAGSVAAVHMTVRSGGAGKAAPREACHDRPPIVPHRGSSSRCFADDGAFWSTVQENASP